jgi:hypothetical protein
MKFTGEKPNGLDLDDGENAAVEAAWAAEIEKRIAEVESGEAKISTWEEDIGVLARLSRCVSLATENSMASMSSGSISAT